MAFFHTLVNFASRDVACCCQPATANMIKLRKAERAFEIQSAVPDTHFASP